MKFENILNWIFLTIIIVLFIAIAIINRPKDDPEFRIRLPAGVFMSNIIVHSDSNEVGIEIKGRRVSIEGAGMDKTIIKPIYSPYETRVTILATRKGDYVPRAFPPTRIGLQNALEYGKLGPVVKLADTTKTNK